MNTLQKNTLKGFYWGILKKNLIKIAQTIKKEDILSGSFVHLVWKMVGLESLFISQSFRGTNQLEKSYCTKTILFTDG